MPEARDVVIDVLDSGSGTSKRCAVQHDGTQLVNMLRITCAAGTKGRFVNISVTGLNQSLSLCEVHIFQIPIPGKTVPMQSPLYKKQ